MPEKMHRTQILLRPEQHAELARIAEAEGRSISDVVRQIVAEALERRDGAVAEGIRRRRAALERVREHRAAILASRGGQPLDFDVVAAVDEAREEQDERNYRLIFAEGD